MAIKTIMVVVAGLLSCAEASPVPSKKVKDEYADAKVVYDQRQEGEWNVRAHLDNFVIMIIPAPASPSSPTPSLLDLLTKSVPHPKRPKQASKQQTPDAAVETMHFIESKTAPYHVDLTKETTAEGVGGSWAQSGGRRARQVVVGGDEYVVSKSKKGGVAGKKGKGGLVLLGAGVEQCGPGMARDSYGICRVYKKY